MSGYHHLLPADRPRDPQERELSLALPEDPKELAKEAAFFLPLIPVFLLVERLPGVWGWVALVTIRVAVGAVVTLREKRTRDPIDGGERTYRPPWALDNTSEPAPAANAESDPLEPATTMAGVAGSRRAVGTTEERAPGAPAG